MSEIIVTSLAENEKELKEMMVQYNGNLNTIFEAYIDNFQIAQAFAGFVNIPTVPQESIQQMIFNGIEQNPLFKRLNSKTNLQLSPLIDILFKRYLGYCVIVFFLNNAVNSKKELCNTCHE